MNNKQNFNNILFEIFNCPYYGVLLTNFSNLLYKVCNPVNVESNNIKGNLKTY
jgi:hypothetical protein